MTPGRVFVVCALMTPLMGLGNYLTAGSIRSDWAANQGNRVYRMNFMVSDGEMETFFIEVLGFDPEQAR